MPYRLVSDPGTARTALRKRVARTPPLLFLNERDLESVRVGDREGIGAPRRPARLEVEDGAVRPGALGDGVDVLDRGHPEPKPFPFGPVATLGEVVLVQRDVTDPGAHLYP